VSIDHDAEEPLYLQLAGILRGQIERGELERRVPSVKTLTQQYGVAQGTAERALAVLRGEGTDPQQDGPRSLRGAARRARLTGAPVPSLFRRTHP
jgi:DNA-binding transcriptional regulator YhcF (GntR family)